MKITFEDTRNEVLDFLRYYESRCYVDNQKTVFKIILVTACFSKLTALKVNKSHHLLKFFMVVNIFIGFPIMKLRKVFIYSSNNKIYFCFFWHHFPNIMTLIKVQSTDVFIIVKYN